MHFYIRYIISYNALFVTNFCNISFIKYARIRRNNGLFFKFCRVWINAVPFAENIYKIYERNSGQNEKIMFVFSRAVHCFFSCACGLRQQKRRQRKYHIAGQHIVPERGRKQCNIICREQIWYGWQERHNSFVFEWNRQLGIIVTDGTVNFKRASPALTRDALF